MTDMNEEAPSLPQSVVASLLENFDCQPVLFVGAGLARRYIGAPDWESALRIVLDKLPSPKVTYEYLAQKFADDKILIGNAISDLVFEWAWHAGKEQFPEGLFHVKSKSVFLRA